MNRPLSFHVDGFIAARRYAPTSATQRRSILRGFARATGDPRPADLSPVLVLDWWAGLASRPAATAAAYYRAVAGFCRHLTALHLLDGDPLAVITPPHVPSVDPVGLTAAEVRAVIAGATRPRTRAIIALMLGCGLRAVDVSRLHLADVDLAAGIMRVTGKGGRVADVPIPGDVIDALVAYLTHRGDQPGPLLLATDSEGGLSARWIADIARRHLKAVGVKRAPGDGRSGHVLRRTFATTLIEEGASLRDVQTLLRHSSLASTERYLRRPEAARLRGVVERGPFALAS